MRKKSYIDYDWGVSSRAHYSNDGMDRYSLVRRIHDDKYDNDNPPLVRGFPDIPRLTAVMLNPSTATEKQNDPTVDRVVKRGFRAGYPEVEILNLHPIRATDPGDLNNNLGDLRVNIQVLADSIYKATILQFPVDFLCAWGTHAEKSSASNRFVTVLNMHVNHAAENGQRIPNIYTLGTTKNGHPKHPLYISYAQEMREWTKQERESYVKNH